MMFSGCGKFAVAPLIGIQIRIAGSTIGRSNFLRIAILETPLVIQGVTSYPVTRDRVVAKLRPTKKWLIVSISILLPLEVALVAIIANQAR